METCRLNREGPQDAVIPMEQQESVILLKHCKELQRQERRMRLITLSLILSFAAVFSISLNIIRDSIEKATFKSPEFLGQQAIADQVQPGTTQNSIKPSVHLTTPFNKICNASASGYTQWAHRDNFGLIHLHGFTYNEANSSLVVPQDGRYFVYVGINFRNNLQLTHIVTLKVQIYTEDYKDPEDVMEVKDSIPAEKEVPVFRRTLYTGQVLVLTKGAFLMVKLDTKSYELIDCQTERNMYFGAFLL
ncbi:hypothetical protein DPEC_G00321460 [Dallia pectoralis]|uniref:Uncharacterized protein n=1 Tax=Dallia pectoralis TaxID=75939 RepID=A0ACC2FAC1_DALPE|nr:hypothetical protein DPEC_G00321460 [Dallia pectoralis]